MKQKIYAVEDDAAICELYMYALENEFECSCFGDGGAFFEALGRVAPDLVLLDIMLPGDDGFAILARLKADKATAHVPIVIVSAKGEEISKVKGLNMGADDYIAKPFGVLELIARIKANLRKGGPAADNVGQTGSIIWKDITVNLLRHQIVANGRLLQTSLKEYDLLCLLCENADRVVERETIFNSVWGDSFFGETRTLDMHIKELRKKLSVAGCSASIQTVRGVGYMMS